jgi:hypothetical protein
MNKEEKILRAAVPAFVEIIRFYAKRPWLRVRNVTNCHIHDVLPFLHQ